LQPGLETFGSYKFYPILSFITIISQLGVLIPRILAEKGFRMKQILNAAADLKIASGPSDF